MVFSIHCYNFFHDNTFFLKKEPVLRKRKCICIATMKMQDTRYMRTLIPFQAYVNLPIQNRIALRKGEKKILNFIILDTFL
jgi:hypothetical protein